jgi:hypothetical protein
MTQGSADHPIHTLCATVMVLATLVPTAAAAQSTPAMPRVRSENPLIAQLIAEASLLSASFRDLATAIDATDGIVYVASGQCGGGAKACLSHSLHVAGPHRMLRVLIKTRRDREGLIGAIGHELHHALEILRDPEITTMQAMFFHFFGESQSLRNRFETDGAIEVGVRIEVEVRDRMRALRDERATR